ncbi:MAG: DUF1109 family protein [Leptospiraceae bacterium]|nr:DUF1109 family protein [Leptospiraceae bacterium]
MKTGKLIQELSSQLTPVKRIYPVWISFIFWIGFSFIATSLFVWNRSGNFTNIHIPVYLHELIFILLVILSSAYIALYTSIPGNRIRNKYQLAPVLFFILWAGSILVRSFISNKYFILPNFSYHYCAKDIILMSLPSTSVFVFLINRRFTTNKYKMGFFVLAASACVSAIGVAFLCPNETSYHLFWIHFLPVLTLSLFGIVLSSMFFKEV